MAALQVLSLLVLFIFPVACQIISPVCYARSSKYVGPKLPMLPSAFTATIEANIVNKNYSTQLTEFYDGKKNFGAVRNTRRGQTFYTISDYNHDEVISIQENTRSCRVLHISQRRRNFFGPCVPTEKGNCQHIEGVSELFRFGAKFNETWIGEEYIRGIRCNHWRTCINSNHSSYTLDYYFSVAEWNATFGYPQTVVRAEINGTGLDHHHGANHSLANGTHNFYHVYDFFSFIPGPPKPDSFQIPRGLYCQGMVNTKTRPEVPYKVFSNELEMVFHSRNRSRHTVSHFKEMYDSRRNLVQLEIDPRTNMLTGEKHSSAIVIFDFNTDIIYYVDFKTQNCTPVMMNERNSQTLGFVDQHHIRLRNTMDLFFRQDKTKTITYTGTAKVRGIDADVWIERFNTSWIGRNRTYNFTEVREIYFSKPSWNMKSWSLPEQHQVPLQFQTFVDNPNCTGGQCSWIFNVYNFNSNPRLPAGAFDIRQCFTPKQRKVVHFSLIGNYGKYAQRDKLPITYAVMDSIVRTANVSSIRISGVEIYHVHGNEEVIGIELYLLDKTNIPGAEYPVYEKSLNDAVLAIKDAVEEGKLSITYSSGTDSKTVTMRAKRSSYYEGKGVIVDPFPRSKKSRGVPGGAVAGIAVLMLVIGLVVGLGVAHWQAKKKGVTLFAYQRQDRE